jgi:hypothetical protein
MDNAFNEEEEGMDGTRGNAMPIEIPGFDRGRDMKTVTKDLLKNLDKTLK